MATEKKYNYLMKNTLLFTISSFGSKIVTFLLVPLYTLVLSTGDYGTADLISTTAYLLIYVFSLNIADGVLRFAIERKQKQDEVLACGVNVLFKGTIVLCVVMAIVAKLNLINWEKCYYFFLLATFFAIAIYQLLSNYLRAIDHVASVALAGIISTVVTVVFNIYFLVVLKIGIFGYLFAMILGPSASALFCLSIIIKNKHVILLRNKNPLLLKSMLNYSIPLIFNSVAWWMNSSLDKYFVTALRGVATNGIYAISYKIPTMMSMFQQIFSQAWNLSAIKEFDTEDKDGFFAQTYSFYNAALVVVCSALILLNIPIAKFLFSNNFFEAWKYSSVLLLSILFSGLSGFVGSIFTAVKNSKIFAVSTVISAVINVALNSILIPIAGAQGAAIATATSFASIWIIRLICAKRYINWHINLIKDSLVYGLLILQVVCEHSASHGYLGQIVIFLTIIILYKKYICKAIYLIMNKIMNRGKIDA